MPPLSVSPSFLLTTPAVIRPVQADPIPLSPSLAARGWRLSYPRPNRRGTEPVTTSFFRQAQSGECGSHLGEKQPLTTAGDMELGWKEPKDSVQRTAHPLGPLEKRTTNLRFQPDYCRRRLIAGNVKDI
ncbi:uncharacterized protein LOC123320580 [Coccinella septempunctata]|uniref:uncharacterized protein LOC123320580 n=1 Tax=Coccinella septempunctata TaxID=41139 RepID=UPI001D06C821|nr:uncharacterized protein LOC123320580 [Coccinella septempunctata]